jgi:LmbE family N-acetylglucosaminyl deacetylase
MEINKNTKLLVISPHPDDEALGVGGLIGKCAMEGAQVMIVYMCVGNSRQLVTEQTDLDTRLQEIEEVKQFTGADIHIMYKGKEFTRLDVVPQKDMIENIENIIESFKPTIIALPSSTSYNQDHRATFDACMTALRPTPQNVRHFTPCVLEYFEPYFWTARQAKEPNCYINLDENYKGGTLLDFKQGLYKCHKTQVRQDPFPRGVGNMERLAHMYGKEIGVEIAEAYHLLRIVL